MLSRTSTNRVRPGLLRRRKNVAANPHPVAVELLDGRSQHVAMERLVLPEVELDRVERDIANRLPATRQPERLARRISAPLVRRAGRRRAGRGDGFVDRARRGGRRLLAASAGR